jgi:hypothetical protein
MSPLPSLSKSKSTTLAGCGAGGGNAISDCGTTSLADSVENEDAIRAAADASCSALVGSFAFSRPAGSDAGVRNAIAFDAEAKMLAANPVNMDGE